MIYELRIYDIIPNRRGALYDRFKKEALALLKKHRFRLIDMWEPTDAREKLFYLLAWSNATERDKCWRAFRMDPAWQKLKTETEEAGPMVTKMEYYLLESLAFAQRARTGRGSRSNAMNRRITKKRRRAGSGI